MSPFCRQCLGIAREGEARCPLDQEFYLRRDCAQCGRELFPRELYCAHCGSSVRNAQESLLLSADATRGPLVMAFLLDALGVILVVGSQLWSLPTTAAAGVGLIAALFYRALARARGRQTFGQAVFHQLTVSHDAGPSSFAASARRTLAELVWLPWALVRGNGVLGGLDSFSGTYEVRLA